MQSHNVYKVKWTHGDGAWVEQEILGDLGVSKTGFPSPGSRGLVVRESQGKEVTYWPAKVPHGQEEVANERRTFATAV